MRSSKSRRWSTHVQCREALRTGDLRSRHRFSGRKARLLPDPGPKLLALIAEHPDLTLAGHRASAAAVGSGQVGFDPAPLIFLDESGPRRI